MNARRGFALVLTLALLALLVLATYGLSVLVRLNARMAATGLEQVQARQNARLACEWAVAELQRLAGPDDRVTAMAGITGVAPGAGNTTRHWAGVWRSDGTFLSWLASGAQSGTAALRAGVEDVTLVGAATVGAPTSNSEPVIAGVLPLLTADGAQIGRYAYVIIDEGVKTSAFAPAAIGTAPVIFAGTAAQTRLRDALATYAAALPRVLTYEQLAVLPSPAAALTPSTLQDNFHHVALSPRWLVGGELRAGFMNVNTNSSFAWRNLLQTYNSRAPAVPFSNAAITSRGTALQNAIASFSTTGKAARGPFTTLAGVESFLVSVLGAGPPSGSDVWRALAPQLAVRSDTYRVRAYGAAVNAADATRTEAAAYCEAIVQRTFDPAAGATGRRFTITSFRWLGPGDL